MRRMIGMIILGFLFLSGSSRIDAESSFDFLDTDHHWAKKNIERIVQQGYMKGYEDRTFRPSRKVSKEELSVIALSMLEDSSIDTIVGFEDIRGRWSEEIIKKSVALDLVQPLNSQSFAPLQHATRAEVVKAIHQVLQYRGISFAERSVHFLDIVNTPYQKEIEEIASLKIIGGYPDGNFVPGGFITRAEMATLLMRTDALLRGEQIETAQKITREEHIKVRELPKKEPVVEAETTVIQKISIETQTGEAIVSGSYSKNQAQRVLELVNQQRAKAGVPALLWDEDLREAAEFRAAEISEKFSHQRPNGEDCFSLASLGTRFHGENIAAFPRSAEEVVDLWMDSPGHRSNILNPDYTHLNVAVFTEQHPKKYNGKYWVQLFKIATN